MVVGDNVRVSEGTQDVELGRELFALLLRHLDVIDFLPAQDLEPVRYALHSSLRQYGATHESI